MDDVTIHVKSDNDTASGFTAARATVEKYAKDTVQSLGKAGVQGGEQLGSSLTKSLSSLLPEAAPLIAVGLAGAAPLIAGTISAGIIGGAGIGGVIGGVIEAAKDARVQTAFQGMSDDFQKRLQKGASGFVEPTIAAIGRIKQALGTIDIEQIFGDSSKFVAPLAEGIGKAITSIGNGVEDLVHNAGPVIDSISNGISDLGESVGEGLSSISDNAPGAARSLDEVVAVMNLGIKGSFGFVNSLMEVNDQLNSMHIPVDAGLQDITALMHLFDKTGESVGTFTEHTVEGVTSVSDATGIMMDQMNAAADATSNLANVTLDLFGSVTKVAEAEDDAKNAIKKNGATLDEHTKKGQDNRDALVKLGQALSKNSDNYRELNGIGPKTDANNERNRASFESAARGMGKSASEAHNLANQIFGIPTRRHTKVDAETQKARDNLREVQRAISGIHNKSVTISVFGYKSPSAAAILSGNVGGLAHGGIKGAADGGFRDNMTLVGEEGPELVDLPVGSRVTTAGDSRRAMQQASSGGGWGSGDIVLQAPGGKELWRYVLPHAQKMGRDRYSNDPVKMLKG